MIKRKLQRKRGAQITRKNSWSIDHGGYLSQRKHSRLRGFSESFAFHITWEGEESKQKINKASYSFP